jgi:quercetin dioxygenase-like cupin family protein
MSIFRIYTGADGKSYLEQQSLREHPMLRKPQSAAHIVFAEQPGGTFIDWHPAPRRQYVILISGELEIGFGDGTLRRFGPGDARLVEDTTGQGHTTRFIGTEPVITAIIPLT